MSLFNEMEALAPNPEEWGLRGVYSTLGEGAPELKVGQAGSRMYISGSTHNLLIANGIQRFSEGE